MTHPQDDRFLRLQNARQPPLKSDPCDGRTN